MFIFPVTQLHPKENPFIVLVYDFTIKKIAIIISNRSSSAIGHALMLVQVDVYRLLTVFDLGQI